MYPFPGSGEKSYALVPGPCEILVVLRESVPDPQNCALEKLSYCKFAAPVI